MRVFLVASVVLVMLFVANAVSISSSSAETSPRIEVNLDNDAPGVERLGQFACASCSHADICTHYERFVETEIVKEPSTAFKNARGARSFANDCIYGMCNHRHLAAIASIGADRLKLPSVAVANGDEHNAHEAASLKVEVLDVGVRA